MAKANAHALPGSLESLGAVCNLPEHLRKLTGDDYKLIDTFCIPQRASDKFIEPWERPDDWKKFCEYALRDTETLRAIDRALPTSNYRDDTLRDWWLDQLVNGRGFGFDKPLAKAAVGFLSRAKIESDLKISGATGGAVHAATQRDRLLQWLREHSKINIESLRASEVTEWLEHDDLDPTTRLLLEQRLEAGRSAGSKYKRGLGLVGPEDCIRHWCRWNGAGRTGRHSGRGFQPHNMARPTLRVRRPDTHAHAGRIELQPVKAAYIDDVIIPGIYSNAALNEPLIYGGPYEACSLAMRHVIISKAGQLMAGDFKNIESVVTAWIAGETAQLAQFEASFASHGDPAKDVYCILAGKILGKDPKDVNETERQMGKVMILAFGFGGGVSALVNMAITYQLGLDPLADLVLPTATPEQLWKAEKAWRRAFLRGEDFGLERVVYMACDVLKQAYRTTNAAIDRLRKDVDVAVKNAIMSPDDAVYNVGRCKIFCTGTFLVIELPSGRRLLYANPELKTESIIDPDGGEPWTSSYMTYATARGRGWRRERAWSGLFVENMVQAIAADVLRAAMRRLHADTLTVPAIKAYLDTLPLHERTAIALHVHDEVCLDVPKGSYSKERLVKVMTTRPAWASDLPIAVDSWVHERFGKR